MVSTKLPNWSKLDNLIYNAYQPFTYHKKTHRNLKNPSSPTPPFFEKCLRKEAATPVTHIKVHILRRNGSSPAPERVRKKIPSMMSMVVSWTHRYITSIAHFYLYTQRLEALYTWRPPLPNIGYILLNWCLTCIPKKTFVRYSIMFNQKKEHEDASIWHLQFGGPECYLLRSPAKQNWKGKSVHDLSSLGLLS